MYNRNDSDLLIWRPKLGWYSNASGNCKFYPDTETATSYTHWQFLRRIDGKLVFNDWYYSSQTRSHQDGLRQLLQNLGIKIDLEVSRYNSLSKYNSLKDFLTELEKEKAEHRAQAKNKRLGNWRKNALLSSARETQKCITRIQQLTGYKLPKAKKVAAKTEAAEKRAQAELESKERFKAAITALRGAWRTRYGEITLPAPSHKYVIKADAATHKGKALECFLNTTETKKRFGSLFIDGDSLYYRKATGHRLAEMTLAKKLISESGETILIVNSNWNVTGYVSKSDFEGPASFIPFDSFQKLDLASVLYHRITGKIPGQNESEES